MRITIEREAEITAWEKQAIGPHVFIVSIDLAVDSRPACANHWNGEIRSRAAELRVSRRAVEAVAVGRREQVVIAKRAACNIDMCAVRQGLCVMNGSSSPVDCVLKADCVRSGIQGRHGVRSRRHVAHSYRPVTG